MNFASTQERDSEKKRGGRDREGERVGGGERERERISEEGFFGESYAASNRPSKAEE